MAACNDGTLNLCSLCKKVSLLCVSRDWSMHSSGQRPLSNRRAAANRQCLRRLVPGRMRAATTERRHPASVGVCAAPPHLLGPACSCACHKRSRTCFLIPLPRHIIRHQPRSSSTRPRPAFGTALARTPPRPPQHASPISGARLACMSLCSLCDGWLAVGMRRRQRSAAHGAAHAAAPARGGAHACAAVAATRSGAACSTCRP